MHWFIKRGFNARWYLRLAINEFYVDKWHFETWQEAVNRLILLRVL